MNSLVVVTSIYLKRDLSHKLRLMISKSTKLIRNHTFKTFSKRTLKLNEKCLYYSEANVKLVIALLLSPLKSKFFNHTLFIEEYYTVL